MFAPISIDDFIKSYKENNPKENAAELREALVQTVKAKKNGAVCHICGQPTWAVGRLRLAGTDASLALPARQTTRRITRSTASVVIEGNGLL
jgi:hypothetical protein